MLHENVEELGQSMQIHGPKGEAHKQLRVKALRCGTRNPLVRPHCRSAKQLISLLFHAIVRTVPD